jgi:AmmeMemoRadiSam system protein B/AmmeMemoRadiSam system protein A
MKTVFRFFVLAFIFSALPAHADDTASALVKESSIAGRWYSSKAGELSAQIDELLSKAPHGAGVGEPVMLILPHAGYRYSGPTAAAGYRRIGARGKSLIDPDLIVLLGPSHHKSFRGCALLPADYINTPLGKVKVARSIADKLLADGLFKKDPSAFELEHSIEIHLPFLQRIFGKRLSDGIRILPVLVGDLEKEDAGHAASVLYSAISGSRPFFIVSSDFTHYGPDFGYTPFGNKGSVTARRIKELDYGAIGFILKKDLAGFSGYVADTGITICGRNPIAIALALPSNGLRAELVSYDTSGSVTGDYTNSVSYAAIVFIKTNKKATHGVQDPPHLTAKDQRFLLKAARDNIASWLHKRRGIRFFPPSIPPDCLVKRGAFVTLKIGSELRGCVGNISGDKPLIQVVLDCSYNAAFRDPRFLPLNAGELDKITIEISVLTIPDRVRSADEITVGRDGIIIERGLHRGLLLPKVAVEQGWDRVTFLNHACLKAGLPQYAWREKGTTIYRFQATVFSEGK